jgi:hypothetical protein
VSLITKKDWIAFDSTLLVAPAPQTALRRSFMPIL